MDQPNADVSSANPGPATMPPAAPAVAAKSGGGFQTYIKISALVFGAMVIFGMGFYSGLGVFVTDPGSPIDAEVYEEGDGTRTVVILPIKGMITSQMVPFVRHAVNQILNSKKVGAVVIRVDSGGGTVSASDQIHHLVQQISKEKNIPVVASYGGLAASGGYYVSCMADHIVAEPSTVTGSIGVIAQVLTFEKLLKDKLGIEPVVMTASGSPSKRVGNQVFETWSDLDKAKVQKMLDAMHDRFVHIVREGRGKKLTDKSTVETVADGSIFLADEAVAKGVVDQVGYLDEAIDKAIALGDFKSDKPRVLVLRPRVGLLQELLMGSAQEAGAAAASGKGLNLAEIDPETARHWMNELSSPKMMYLYRP